MGTLVKGLQVLAAALLCATSPARADRYESCFDRTDPDKAIVACTSLINNETMTTFGAAAVHVSRGLAREDKGAFDGAFTDFRQAMTYRPTYELAYHSRGRLYFRVREYDRAIRDANSAIKLDAKDALAYDLRAIALAELGRAEEARADTAKSAALAGDSALVNNARCWLRAVVNRDLDTALAACDVSIAKEPRATNFDSRGFVNFRLGKLAQARADYDASLALKPRSPHSLFMRGVILRRAGGKEGDTDISAAIALNPNIQNEYAGYGVTP